MESSPSDDAAKVYKVLDDVRSVADIVIETGVPQHRVRVALRTLKGEGAVASAAFLGWYRVGDRG